MNQILSQSEVDALLAAVTDGDVKTAESSSTSQVQVKDDKNVINYDLTS